MSATHASNYGQVCGTLFKFSFFDWAILC